MLCYVDRDQPHQLHAGGVVTVKFSVMPGASRGLLLLVACSSCLTMHVSVLNQRPAIKARSLPVCKHDSLDDEGTMVVEEEPWDLEEGEEGEVESVAAYLPQVPQPHLPTISAY